MFREFLGSLAPLRDTGKLGGILFQMPPYVVWKPSSLDYLEWANDQLGDDQMLFEPRHRSWFDEDDLREWVPPLRDLSQQAEETYAFFNNNNVTNGVAQAPAGAQLLRRLLDEEHVPSA